MKNIIRILTISTAFSFVFTACSDDDDSGIEIPHGDYDNGILVSGEGGSVDGSISFISNDFTTVETQIYNTVNGEGLGVYLQSIGFEDDKAYIVVDNASTIMVVNRYTFEKIGEITTGLQTPRYIDFEDGKGYVSNWGNPSDATDDFVAVVNLNTFIVEDTIPVGEGPERVLVEDDKIFVSHKGGYNYNNIVSVIDESDYAVNTIEVADNPDEMDINEQGDLVVLSSGRTIYDNAWNVIGSTPGAITKINTSSETIEAAMDFESDVKVSLMDYEDDKLYYVANSAVYVMNDNDSTLPTSPIIDLSNVSNAYGFAVEDNYLYVADASFSGASSLHVYNLNSNTLETTINGIALGASKIYLND